MEDARGQVNVQVSPTESVLEQHEAQYAPSGPALYCCASQSNKPNKSATARYETLGSIQQGGVGDVYGMMPMT